MVEYTGWFCRGLLRILRRLRTFRRDRQDSLRPGELDGAVAVEEDLNIPLPEAGTDSAGDVKVSRRQGQSRQHKGGGSGK